MNPREPLRAAGPGPSRKLFIGPRIRRLREQMQWNQAELASRLALSLSYVSQIETNQRPVTASVLIKLAEVFGGGIGQFSEEQDQQLLHDLDAALRDRSLTPMALAPTQVARLVEQAPELAEAYVALHQRYLRLQDEHSQMIDRFYGEQGPEPAVVPVSSRGEPLPHEAVRDHLNRRNNHLDELDLRGEQLAEALGLTPGQRARALRELLQQRYGIKTEVADEDEGRGAAAGAFLRQYDARRRVLRLPRFLSDAQQAFQLATQYALIAEADAIEAELRAGAFVDDATRALAKQGFAHYFAGATLLPYVPFLEAARQVRYDVELLQQRFQVSVETICHRLSTLQRNGNRGVPFYFVRVDQAGNISKRQSATSFHFARHGGACPLWHVHEAFAQPGRFLRQIAEMPDGSRFFGIARTIERHGGGGYQSRRKLFAVGLGCDLAHARELVYADGLALDPETVSRRAVPIGPGCRVCPREHCVQRAFPPAGKALVADSDSESLVSYRFTG
ncbi:short-chain fatty acyl-CoA regulator family protein [Mitsuaria sp. GD03876]|uniref:helix-turn-helix domain-containing protein n=1 Tax=Mitsuaria sp. GD03876 TaxID=2975399 RepID=UPI002448785C|nr:short-chain fatty acyl-CoA regulator family protein [Mitsuaria sp. GD03876]MDH0863164.1 short-chain fatty acyl-CoA regulator family protein [Mitsuaria sp. GD03876]